jgi:predicted ATP-dependent serine protease
LVKEQKKRTSVPYEFDGLNWLTDGGSCLGDLVVVVGNTGLGKSTLATQMVGRMWHQQGYKTLIYSGEMDATSVIHDLSV